MSQTSPFPDSRPIGVLLGPTCSGKTAMAVSLAGEMRERGWKLEIIGADARQIYRRLTVGTAKPTQAERNAVPHHMVDVAELPETFNAARYAAEARQAIEGVYERGAFPLVVGGSGLYIRALVEGLFEGPGADEDLRRELEYLAEREGSHVLHGELMERDPHTANQIHPNDLRRIIRALEVFEITGRPISELRKEARRNGFLRPFYLGISWPAGDLALRIEKRVRAMLKEGMAGEAAMLAGLNLMASRSFEGLGYAEALAFYRGKMGFEEAVDALSRLHRNYAKRQRTWFRRMEGIHWLSPADHEWDELIERAGDALEAYLEGFPSLVARSAP